MALTMHPEPNASPVEVPETNNEQAPAPAPAAAPAPAPVDPLTLPPQKRPRVAVSQAQKAALRAYRREHPELSQDRIAEWFRAHYGQKATQGQISNWLSPQYAYLDELAEAGDLRLGNKKRRPERWPELERPLRSWHFEEEEQGVKVTGDMLRAQAAAFWPQCYPQREVPGFSNGWLAGYRERYRAHKQQKTRRADRGADTADTSAADDPMRWHAQPDIYETPPQLHYSQPANLTNSTPTSNEPEGILPALSEAARLESTETPAERPSWAGDAIAHASPYVYVIVKVGTAERPPPKDSGIAIELGTAFTNLREANKHARELFEDEVSQTQGPYGSILEQRSEILTETFQTDGGVNLKCGNPEHGGCTVYVQRTELR